MTELESTITAVRSAGGTIAKHFVKVGSNYYCHLTGATISAAEYASLVSRITSQADGLTHEERQRKYRLHAAVDRAHELADRKRRRSR